MCKRLNLRPTVGLITVVAALAAFLAFAPGALAGVDPSGSLAQPTGSLLGTGAAYNPTHWAVQAGDSITGTITGATDAQVGTGGCDSTVGVLVTIQSSNFGNTPLCGTLSGSTITFTWAVDSLTDTAACGTTIVSYNALGNLTNNALLPKGTGNAAGGFAIVDANGDVVTCGGEQLPPAADLKITKNAVGSYDQPFTWGITKAACEHGVSGCVQRVEQVGGSVTFDYTITVTRTAGTPSNVKVTGTITVTNPNVDSVVTTADGVTDQLSDATVCTVTGGAGPLTLSSGDTIFNYSCSLGSLPTADISNTATVSWPTQDISDGHLAGNTATKTVGPISFTENDIDACTYVTDPNAPTTVLPATVCGTTTFNYSKALSVPQFGCQDFKNTATETPTVAGPQSASQTATLCGPAKTGALTMGFWQNKNGQAIITGGLSTSGVCNSGTWLRGFSPFQDLSATASCSAVATYVTNVIKAANASGSAMNAMLKAQMLATALDVYFSDTTLGGNKINAPSPIGAQKIDLTMICKMIDGSGGIATCSGTYQNTSLVFGGSACQTVLALLTYENSVSNVGGTTWYANVKATQEQAKNTFDAINNQVVFNC
jgi:hypothetical protein